MMQNEKEAAPVLQYQDGQMETGPALQTGPHLHHDFTTAPPPGQAVKIADFLSRGEAHAVPLRHLRELLHLDGRTVRLMIRQERLHGVPILENSRTGYYLPDNDHERAKCIRRLRKRAAEIGKIADCIEKAEV